MIFLESKDQLTIIILRYTCLCKKHLPVEYGLPTSFAASKLATAVVIIVVVVATTAAVVIVTAAAVIIVVVRHTGDQTSAVAHHFAVIAQPA
jgi:hypothetical protein